MLVRWTVWHTCMIPCFAIALVTLSSGEDSRIYCHQEAFTVFVKCQLSLSLTQTATLTPLHLILHHSVCLSSCLSLFLHLVFSLAPSTASPTFKTHRYSVPSLSLSPILHSFLSRFLSGPLNI